MNYITKDEFIAKATPIEDGYEVVACDCGIDMCEGWQIRQTSDAFQESIRKHNEEFNKLITKQ